MIYLWYPQGRLGNLIFQYQAIAAISEGHPVLALSNDFFDLFEYPRRFAVLPVPRRLRWRAERWWTSLLDGLVRRGLVGSIEPTMRVIEGDIASETRDLVTVPGRLKSVFVVKGFFQSSQYQFPLPSIAAAARVRAEAMLRDVPRSQRVAIHMRFGDYVTWPVFGVPGLGALPAAYYLDAIEEIGRTVPDATFVVISDDRKRAAEILGDHQGRIRFVDGGSALDDFTLIASCGHAILSASSYSWWAAALIEGGQPLIVAPKYWLGFRKRLWFPTEIACDRFTYIEFAT
jgi:hypothetical protein